MNNNVYYIELMLIVEHPYFSSGRLPLRITPTASTRQYFRENKLSFRKQAWNTWWLIGEGSERESEEELCFEINPLSPVWHYITAGSSFRGAICELTSSSPVGIWKELKISSLGEEKIIKWDLEVKKFYWEYIVFFRSLKPEGNWYITEKQERVCFEKPETELWHDQSEVFRTISKEKIPIQTFYPYTLQIKEDRNGRERIIYEINEYPFPQELSTKKSDTITTYIYL